MVADCIPNRIFWLAVGTKLLGPGDGGRIMAVSVPAQCHGEYSMRDPLPEEE